MASRPFSPSAAWDEVGGVLRGETRLLVAIAGVFFLLPAAVTGIYSPPLSTATGFAQIIELMRPYLPLLFVASLVQYVGQLAIMTLVLSPERPTVGASIARGLALLPFYFLLMLVTSLLIGLGLLLLILPGLYLVARLAPAGAAFVAERLRWPFAVIGRAFALTAGNALQIFAFLAIVFVVYLLISLVVGLVFGAIFGLLGLGMEPREPGAMLLAVLGAIVSASGTTIFTLMGVAIYRQLAGDRRAAGVFS